MRIARLDLYGFKSFPDRTSFEFGPGVSCVVGPNGSGKSNVVDAMRWCIGEQSARSLRGSEMLDVIFAGSADRPPVGFAEVRMTFASDTGEPFPGEYAHMAELQVGRRLHRNGTSEYALNGVKCRRRDIVDLFLDTGVGNNLYSFIAQGQVEKIVHASAAERRGIIDEAAGISRYVARRAEAQQRLEATGAQLDRAADVADEMSRRIKVLERQVVKAADFRRLRALIRQEEIFLSLVRYRELAADRRALRESQRQLENEAAANRRELARRQNDLVQRREELAVVEAAASKWRDEVAELDARSRELEGARVFQDQRSAELTEQAERQRTEAAEAAEAIARDQAAADAATAEIARFEAQLGEGASAREARRQAAEDAAAARTAVRKEQVLAEAEARRLAANALQIEARAEAAARDRERLGVELEAARSAIEPARAALERRADAAAAVERAVAEAREAAGRAARALDEVQALASGAGQASEAADAAVGAAEAELDAARAALDEGVEAAARQAEERRRDAELEVADAERRGADAIADARREAERAADRIRELALARRERLEAIRADRTRMAGELASLNARLSTLESERRAVLAAARALPGLADPRALADRLGLDADEARAWAERAGDRLLLPVVVDAAELRAALGGIEGQARVLLASGADPRPRWDALWARFTSVEDAVAHHLASGGGAVAPGLRIDPDGVAWLGPPEIDRALARRERLDREIAGARAELETTRELHAGTGVAAVELIEAELERIPEDPMAWATDALAEIEARGVAEAGRVGRRAVGQAEDLARTEVEAAREALDRAIEAVTSARDRARAEGEARIAQARDAVGAARQERASARATAESAGADRDRVARAAAAAELAVSRADGELQLARALEREARAALDGIAEQVSTLELRIRELGEARVELQRGAQVAAAEAARHEEVLRGIAERLERAEAAEREAQGIASATAAQAQALVERLEGAREAARAASERADESRIRQVRLADSASELTKSATAAREASLAASAELKTTAEARGGAWDKLQRERTRVGKLREALATAEKDGIALQEKATGLAARVAELDGQGNQVRAELELLRGNMEDRYQVSLSALLDRAFVGPVTLEAPPEVRERFEVAGRSIEPVEDLVFTRSMLEDADRVTALVEQNREHRAELARLGEVNLGALEEYGDLDLRYRELVAQREDLETSVADIRRAIARMNRTCRQRFRDAFDRVNEHFQEVYPRLVGGGSARLSLTDEEDLLQTGVEIYVQPPGKRLQNLSLLSGGEKAMTAIALLIAIFKVKPSPFCVLDEVDAPLDEANGTRFNDILREMSAFSQFVVITHNRKTMECADTLYGVTMGRPGVSKLVSVNLAG